MGGGRFGKYGEMKRLDRLRQSKRRGDRWTRPPFGSFKKKSPVGVKTTQARRRGVRPARPSDAPFVRVLAKKVFCIYGPYDEILHDWFGLDFTLTLIATIEGRPVGFAMLGMASLTIADTGFSELMAIAVEPEIQKKGLGAFLLRAIEDEARKNGVERVYLHTAQDNIPARRLFSKQGYKPDRIKIGFYPNGQDALFMSKEIRSGGRKPDL
jgi:ribosomal protein S18 acetylase RimI-like enzyme